MKKNLKLFLAALTALGLMGVATACSTEQNSESGSNSQVETPAAEYTVTFVADGETVGTVTYIEGAESITEPEVPAKEHYTGAWEAYELNGNVTVNAVYTATEYTVTFVANGETVATETYTVEDKEITEPTVPAKEHYENGAWEAYELDFTNATVNATYTAIEYTITFNHPKTGMPLAAPITYTVENADSVVFPAVPEDLQMPGMTVAWNKTVADVKGGDLQVEPVWDYITYTITFKSGDEVVGTATYTVESTEITEPAVPAKEGYTGAWGEYSLSMLEDQTVEPVYTANTYKITYNANGGTCELSDEDVVYGEAYTLPTATGSMIQSFVGWMDENGEMFVAGEVWDIASDVTLTAVYETGITFENMTAIPSYMSIVDDTESLAIAEVDGNKVLEIKAKSDKSAPGLMVTTEWLASFFADEGVDYIAFDAKAKLSTCNNFRRVTLRSNGTFAADTYEQDMTYTHPVDGLSYATTGIRSDSWKTFYFSRADYNAWVQEGKESERFIASGQLTVGDSIYVDNIRPVTAAERKAGIGSFESGGVRINDPNGKTLLMYTLDQGTTWQFNIQVGTGGFTNVGYTNEDVTDGIRALQFTKEAGTLSFNFTSGRAFYDELVASTGYYAFDIYVPEDSDLSMSYHTATYPGVTLKKGAWTTIYVKDSKNQVTFSDTTGGTYKVDNLRPITQAEYNLAAVNMEANAGGLRTSNLGDDTAHSGVAYYYGGADHTANTFTFALAEGNGDNDADVLSNVRLASEQAHSGTYSLAFDKKAGYMYITMRNDSTAFATLSSGFSFWIYSTVEIDGVNTSNFYNGNNENFNGGEGIIIPANTWTKVTVTAADMNPTRFLILQGGIEGTIYLDDFQPLE